MGKTGNITGEVFSEAVIRQIEARQTFLGVNPKQDKHLIYQNNKTAFVRLASSTLFFLSSIPVRDASNGFRLFSKKILNLIKIESRVGFAYSLELLVKCDRLKMKILEIPSQWEERSEGQSRFKVFKWLPQYFKWYIYGLTTTWLGKKKI